jgi:predicted Zn-dependent protease with MMP-like domain
MTGTYAPTLDDIEALARAALDTIPGALRRYVHDVVIRVQEFPDAQTCSEMELETEFDLLGLYSGVSLEHEDGGAVREDVNMIFLYRRPLLDYWCESSEELGHLVRHVIIHEVGHHFGFSDDDMEALERLADERAGE